mmetsp:Transcript_92026/g.256386  ORF Transcript_92026/g.256386 Transcript_92026/m.256386 type:complete len:256 (+) Transcript_92026:216-983(+)
MHSNTGARSTARLAHGMARVQKRISSSLEGLQGAQNRSALASGGVRVSSAVARDRNLSQASLALDVLAPLLFTHAAARSKRLKVSRGHRSFVGRSALQKLRSLFQRRSLHLAATVAVVDVLGDEVTPGLDLEQIGLRRGIGGRRHPEVVLLLQELLLLVCERPPQVREVLLHTRLAALQLRHAVLERVLRALLSGVGQGLLLGHLVMDERQHADHARALLTLALVALLLLPRAWACFRLTRQHGHLLLRLPCVVA